VYLLGSVMNAAVINPLYCSIVDDHEWSVGEYLEGNGVDPIYDNVPAFTWRVWGNPCKTWGHSVSPPSRVMNPGFPACKSGTFPLELAWSVYYFNINLNHSVAAYRESDITVCHSCDLIPYSVWVARRKTASLLVIHAY